MDYVIDLLDCSYYPHHAKDRQVTATNEITASLIANPCASLGTLLSIVTHPAQKTDSGKALPSELRFIAATRIKNFFRIDYTDSIETAIKNSPDFSAFKTKLLETVVFLDDQDLLRRQITEAVRILVANTHWNFYDQLSPMLHAVAASTVQSSVNGSGMDVLMRAQALVELAVAMTRTFHFTVFQRAMRVAISRDLLQVLPNVLLLWQRFDANGANGLKLSRVNMHMTHQCFKVFDDIVCDFFDLTKTDECHVPADADLGAAIQNWLSFMSGFIDEYLGAFMAAHNNDMNAVGQNRSYLSFVRIVKRIGIIAFSFLENATKRPTAAAKMQESGAKAATASKKKGAKAAAAAAKGPKDASSWVTQHYFLAGVIPATILEVFFKWLQWCTQQRPADLQMDSDIRTAERKGLLWCIRYVKVSIMVESLYRNVIIAHFDELIGLLFGALCFNDEDQEVYDDSVGDLQAFCMALEEDAFSDQELTLRQACSNCIVAFTVAKRTFHDGNLIYKILEALNGSLSVGVDPNTHDEIGGNPRQIYGYLHLLGHMKLQMKARPELWGPTCEQALITHVVPRINSAHIFLRVKAVQVLYRYARMPLSSNENMGTFVQIVSSLLQDHDDRVRLAAIDTMCEYLALNRARPYLKNILVPLVNECLMMQEKVRTAFIPSALNYLCEHYGYELTPVLDRMCQSMVQQLLAQMHDMKAEVDLLENEGVIDESEAAIRKSEQTSLSAASNFNALYQMATACDHNKDLLRRMVPDLVRPIEAVFTNAALFSLLEEAANLLMIVIYIVDTFMPDLWRLFPHIHELVMNHGDGVDNFSDLATCVDNFLSVGLEQFVTNTDAMRMTLEMCGKMLNRVASTVEPRCRLGAIQILGSLFHQGKGPFYQAISGYIPQMIEIVLTGLQVPENVASDKMMLGLVSTVMDAFWFNPVATLQTLDALNATTYFLGSVVEKFSKLVDHMSSLRRKQFILGITSILQLYIESGGQALQGTLGQNGLTPAAAGLLNIVVRCIKSNAALYTIRSRRLEKLISQEGAEDIEDCDDGDLDLADDDDIDELDGGDDDDEDVDGENVEDNDEDIDYVSPLDEICEVQFFMSWVEAVTAANPPMLQQITDGSMTDLHNAAHVSTRYMGLAKAYSEKDKAISHQRAAELLH